MATSSSDRNPVELLAEEFAERYRRGERPSLSEYTERYPHLANEICKLFPALVMMEQLKPEAPDQTGGFEQPPPEAPAADGHPEQLGDFRIVRQVGRGGMGVVYEAVQVSLGRHVALKVLPPQALLSPTYLERFRREARAAAKLHHTNIVPVYGVGEDAGVHFFAMQFIRGEGLDKVLHDLRLLRRELGAAAKVPMPPTTPPASEPGAAQSLLTGRFIVSASPGPDAAPDQPAADAHGEARSLSALSGAGSGYSYYWGVARVGLQVAEALAYAHRQGILHRDIKPSNLLLDLQGTVWITDFGLAKAEGTDDLTHTGDIVGTMRYMAPERFDGRSLPQSDVYALGLTLYELLTLRPAFADTNKARLVEHVLHQPPLRPRKLDARIPRDLETVVLKCIHKDPSERYATAEALAEDLRRFQADRPIQARRASSAEQLWRWCRRNPAVASLLGTVVALLVAVAVGSLLMAAQFAVERRQADQARTVAEQAERQGRLREAEALMGEAHGIRYSRRPGQRFAALAALKKAAAIGRELEKPPEWFDRLRNEAIAALALPDVHITEEWDGIPPGTVSANMSPDFELYVRTSERGAVSVRRVKDDTEIASLPEVGEKTYAFVSPGGVLNVVYGAPSRRFQLWDVSGPEPVLRLEKQPVWGCDIRPDGKLLVLSLPTGAIDAHDVASGRLVHSLRPGRVVNYPYVVLHPTAPFVAVRSYNHTTFEVRDLRDGRVVAEIDPPWTGGMGGPAWSPDGRTLAVPCGDSGQIQLYTFDPDKGTPRPSRMIEGPEDGGVGVTFNPAGDRLAARGWKGIVRLFDVHTGRLLFSTHSSLGPSAFWTGPRFDPAGTRLAAARVGERNERIGLWSVADAREYRVLVSRWTGADPSGRRPATHPNGRLAVQAFPNGLAFFDLHTGAEVASVAIPRGSTVWGGNMAFDGTGALLTNHFSGFLRWPVHADPTKPGRCTVGPPERLSFNPGQGAVAASRDGRVIAQAMWNGYGESQYAGGWILHPNSPRPRWVNRGASTAYLDVSPDGRWVAFSDKVYEAATGRRVWQAADNGVCRFSPDGRWLVTNGDGGRVHAVGTWEPGVQVGQGTPWDVSPDSTLVVMGLTNGSYRLVALATGRELAKLEDPDQTYGPAEFTPDGTRLVVVGKEGPRVWDLRLTRKGLTELGLDWDAPPYPDAPPQALTPPGAPFEVEVLGAELVDRKKMEEYQGQKAVADLFFNPFDPEAHYRLGTWLLDAGNPERAHSHLGAALTFRPDLDAAWSPRARAAFQLKRWADAVADATHCLEKYPDDGRARFLRARANQMLQRHDKAVADYTALLPTYPSDKRLYESRALCYDALGKPDLAKADREQARKIGPRDPTTLNDRAWQLATGPAGQRDPARALELIQEAIKQQPENATFLNTLGVVQYRNEKYQEAVATLEKSLAAGQGQYDAFDLFFLAMCHAKLDDTAKAKELFDRAVKWVEVQKNLKPQYVEELKAFRAEAEEVLRSP
jgi:serine/threonine protein kinase/tetratricopeptide (TPR) repeat protein/WD40 repeat protein